METVKTDASITLDNKCTVKNAEVNANGVKILGNKPTQTVDKLPTPSTGGGSSGGGSSPAPETTYGVNVTTNGGTVTSDSKLTGYKKDENVTITLMVAASDGYMLTAFTVNGADKKADAADGSIDVTVHNANVAVVATFAKPINTLEVFVVNDATSYAKVPVSISGSANVPTNIGTNPWIAVKVVYGIEPTMSDMIDLNAANTFKVGSTSAPSTAFKTHGQPNSAVIDGAHWRTAYIGTAQMDAATEDALDFVSQYGTIAYSIAYLGVTYTGAVTSKDPSATYFTVSFDTKGGSPVATQEIQTGEKIVLPPTPLGPDIPSMAGIRTLTAPTR